ncbi:hypothetical protein MAR_013910 [Mya arenaria]|uniref:Uncharacterized protein n=1 Tax=Mya arenaria TaxID=6604 RepID=A0ABY7G1A7_MYAAR|nr:hypothetical protein MAR_013909 [Mya arenaria]WAR28206.1 hypothetical protein MAR_013910 [Mya arenaria]
MLFKYTLVLLVCVILIGTSDAWLFRRRNKEKLVYTSGGVKIKLVVKRPSSLVRPEKELGCKDIEGCGGIRDAPSGIGKAGGAAAAGIADGSADMRDAMAAAGVGVT